MKDNSSGSAAKAKDFGDVGANATHVWEFKARFRRNAFGWKSQPAITRIKQAVSEIKKVARKDSVAAGEGAVIFLERVSPAISNVDGSSGSIGKFVRYAIAELSDIIAAAQVNDAQREEWLRRLWKAHQEDEIPYLESVGDRWGEFCATPEIASKWADELLDGTRAAAARRGPFFDGSSACLSALLKAERYPEILALLKMGGLQIWPYQRFGALALANMGRIAEAMLFAESCPDMNTSVEAIAETCEQILLAAGQPDEAFVRFAIDANRTNSYISTYRAIAKKYPAILPEVILQTLISASPEEEYKWFATAKELGLLGLALDLARNGSCDPRTLTRAARDHIESDTQFSLDIGMLALLGMLNGDGYDITSKDVWAAYGPTMTAARALGVEPQIQQAIKVEVEPRLLERNYVASILSTGLGKTLEP